MLFIPSEAGNQWFLGFSLTRFILLIFLFLITAFFLLIGSIFSHTGFVFDKYLSVYQNHKDLIVSFLSLAFVSNLLLLVIPSYQLSSFGSYLKPLQPILILCVLISVESLIFIRIYRNPQIILNARAFFKHEGANRKYIVLFFIILGSFFTLWLLFSFTGFGVRGDLLHWNEVGVPLLNSQIVFCAILFIIGVISVKTIQKHSNAIQTHFKWIDLFLIISLFTVALILWTSTSSERGYLSPGPYPPDYVIYPYSDAATWDLNAQFALIGQGFANGNMYMDHLGYSAFLAILHLMVGQDMNRVVGLQIIVFAIFPIFLFLVGKAIHSRLAGFAIALLAIFHQVNSIDSGKWFGTSHAKLLMTEFPAAVLFSILTAILIFRELAEEYSKKWFDIAIGGILAMLIMLRFNALLLPFTIVFWLLIIEKWNWHRWLRSTLTLFLSILLILSPWMFLSWKAIGTPLFFMGKASMLTNPNFRQNLTVDSDGGNTSVNDGKSKVTPINNDIGKANRNLSGVTTSTLGKTGYSILSHFSHNIISSVLILPLSFQLHDLQRLVFSSDSLWYGKNTPWNGNLTYIQRFLLAVNLTIIALGLTVAWKKVGVVCFTPLMIFLSYNFSTAIARTSGGRYLVPVNWIVILYYAIGLVSILTLLVNFLFQIQIDSDNLIKSGEINPRILILSFLTCFLFMISVVFLHTMIPQRFKSIQNGEVLPKMTELLGSVDAYPISEIKNLLTNPDIVVLQGLSLFPRFYYPGEGETNATKDAYEKRDYSRFVFELIGINGRNQIILPLLQPPSSFPNGTEVFVFGKLVNQEGIWQQYIMSELVIGIENKNIVVLIGSL